MTPGAERKKRLRARQRNGEVVAPVTVNNEIIGWLIEHDHLVAAESEDRKEIGKAIADVLSELAVVHSSKFSGTRAQPNAGGRGLIGASKPNDEADR